MDITVVRRLVDTQFPKWKDLSLRPVERGGWDNRTFRLGDDMLVRMPSSAEYASQVEKEQQWLPRLAPLLPLAIPDPLAMGQPGHGYPWKWSIYRWIEGDTAAAMPPGDLSAFAKDLAQFLLALQKIDAAGGPLPGPHSFYRGGSLQVYDAQTRRAISIVQSKIDAAAALKFWEEAVGTAWPSAPVWVHGDICAGNLLIKNGKLSAVIDFGQLAVGDPACDLAIAWTMFSGKSRDVFRSALQLDDATWNRGKAWVLWKALIIAAGLVGSNSVEGEQCWQILGEIL